MTPRLRDETISLRDLIAQLIDAGKAYARAEIAYLKELATVRGKGAAIGIGFAVVALILIGASLTVLLAAFGMLLAIWLGAAGGLALAAIVGLALAALLAWLGVRRIVGSGDVQ